jgi:hypothetical protein
MMQAMSSPPRTAAALVAAALADPDCGWGVGTFGAIGEFVRDRGEPARMDERSAVTARGALAITLVPGARAIAWERPTARGAWQHGVAVCLPVATAAMHRRCVLTPLGPDRDALRDEDRDALRFDLGLGTFQCDVCVRVADAAAARVLERAAGRSVLDDGLLRELPAMQPQRVFESRLARVEVYGAIPPPGGTTPQGPHTHILPDLLRAGRTHAANMPLPEGWVPALELFPPAALSDAHGGAIPFDAVRHAQFARLLQVFGDPAVLAAKRRVADAIAAGLPPHDDADFGRAERLARRVLLRQLAHTAADSAVLAAWRERFDAAEAADGHA